MPFDDTEYKFKKVGKNVYIGKQVYIRYPEEFECGDNVIIDEFCVFTTKVKIGSYVHVSSHCSITGGRDAQFIMGDFSGMSAGCRIICTSDDYLGSGLTNPTIPAFARAKVTPTTVELKRHSLLGTNVVVYPGVTLEEGAVAGACSLVTKSLRSWGIHYGQPAIFQKHRPCDVILMHGEAILPEHPEEPDGHEE